MHYRDTIHKLLDVIAFEMLSFIKESEQNYNDRWVPAVYIKDTLDLKLVSVPQEGEQYGEKGWLFNILARMLEDQSLLEYRKEGNRAFYRSKIG